MVLKCFPRHGKVDVVRYLMEDVPEVGRKLALIGDKVRRVMANHVANAAGETNSVP